MAAKVMRLHPHIVVPAAAVPVDFRTPRPGRGPKHSNQQVDRAAHAKRLLDKLADIDETAAVRAEEQAALGIDGGHGIYLTFEGAEGFDLKFESLEFSPSGIELCAVRKLPNGNVEATVFVPDGKLPFFLKKISAYQDEDTKPAKDGKTRPKNEDLVANISDVRVAALEGFFTDLQPLFPAPDVPTMWEVWLRKSGKLDHVARFKAHAEALGLKVGAEIIEFIDRVVLIVHGTSRNLARSTELLGALAELRLAQTTADFFTGLNGIEQKAWIDELKKRARNPAVDAPCVTLFDTGVNRAHPLLEDVLAADDLHTYKPAWNVDDRKGHGTPMAGLATYGDLTDVFADNNPVDVTHRLESVKLINEDDQHEPGLYGAVTAEGVDKVEKKAPGRKRVFCMAVTTTDDRDRGRPSSWSAALDKITSGSEGGARRLMFVSAGNTLMDARKDYPNSNYTDGVHDPAQSWNALAVGGYTEKALIDKTKYPAWEALAGAGDLSPCSCTSLTWRDTKWPVKPDIVMEAGNMGRHPDLAPDYIADSLQLLSTPQNFALGKQLTTFGDTSAATALASRLAAMLMAKYPALTPEAVRALMVHAAEWTPAMIKHFTNAEGDIEYENLVRCFGYGVPNQRRLLSSADDALTLVAQGSIRPFMRDDKGEIKTREMKLHTLPWPKEVLQGLGGTDVTLRVTLSYFVEPNPGDRGWSSKYGYQSHGLRVAVKRATENLAQFRSRINKVDREKGDEADAHKETGSWMFKAAHGIYSLGSVHTNTWTGKAADLAAREYMAVFPTYGWWNRRPNMKAYEKTSHYALIATITTPEVDIYTPVATSIGIPVTVET